MQAITVLMLLLLAGCGGSNAPTAPSPAAVANSPFQEYASAHFTFQYTSLDAASVAGTAALVEAEYARIVAELGSPVMTRITIFLHPDFASMQTAVQATAGTLPSFATGLVTNAATIHVISPNRTSIWSYSDGARAIVHEFAHCVTLRINASIANNPRWLWETVALYEAGDFVDPRSAPALASGQPPTLARLNGFDNVDIYQVGFTIGEFIVARWGRDGLVSLIRNNGDTIAITGLGPAALIAEWYEFVRARYFSAHSGQVSMRSASVVGILRLRRAGPIAAVAPTSRRMAPTVASNPNAPWTLRFVSVNSSADNTEPIARPMPS
jgi:hypothetical protein